MNIAPFLFVFIPLAALLVIVFGGGEAEADDVGNSRSAHPMLDPMAETIWYKARRARLYKSHY
jgi:hypothetical protein